MGSTIQLACRECNYSSEFKIGAGMASINETVMEQLLYKEDLEEWTRLKESGKVLFFSWERKLAYCENCKKLECVISVKAKTTEGVVFIGNRCDACHKILNIVEVSNEIDCPFCKTHKLEYRVKGRWD